MATLQRLKQYPNETSPASHVLPGGSAHRPVSGRPRIEPPGSSPPGGPNEGGTGCSSVRIRPVLMCKDRPGSEVQASEKTVKSQSNLPETRVEYMNI